MHNNLTKHLAMLEAVKNELVKLEKAEVENKRYESGRSIGHISGLIEAWSIMSDTPAKYNA